MLPRASRGGVPDNEWLPGNRRADGIRHNSVQGVVSSANDIASPGGGDRTETRSCLEERFPPAMDYEFCSRLARGVRIEPAKRIILAIRVGPFAVLVAFVGRNHDQGTGQFQIT